MSLTKGIIQRKFPDVYEAYTLQMSLPEAKYEEKLRFWETNGINCFQKWTVPYFLEREKERKRPCLRLNYPHDGRCNDCTNGTCRYDKMCFMCGGEGHGAYQSYPGGKLKGEFKCSKHRNFDMQLAAIRGQYGMDEDEIKALFNDLIPVDSVFVSDVPTTPERKGAPVATDVSPHSIASTPAPAASASSFASKAASSEAIHSDSNVSSAATVVAGQANKPPVQATSTASSGTASVSKPGKASTAPPTIWNSGASAAALLAPATSATKTTATASGQTLSPASVPVVVVNHGPAAGPAPAVVQAPALTPGLALAPSLASTITTTPSASIISHLSMTALSPDGVISGTIMTALDSLSPSNNSNNSNSNSSREKSLNVAESLNAMNLSPSSLLTNNTANNASTISNSLNSFALTGHDNNAPSSMIGLLGSGSMVSRPTGSLDGSFSSSFGGSWGGGGGAMNMEHDEATSILSGLSSNQTLSSSSSSSSSVGGSKLLANMYGVSSSNVVSGPLLSPGSTLNPMSQSMPSLMSSVGFGPPPMGGPPPSMLSPLSSASTMNMSLNGFSMSPGMSPGMNNVGMGVNYGNTSGSIVTAEVIDSDEYISNMVPLVRFSPAICTKETLSSQISCVKGMMISNRGNEEVSVMVWSKMLAGSIDALVMKREIRALRLLAKSSIYISKLVSQSVVEASILQGSNKIEMQCIISEHSEIGYLDQFLQSCQLSHPEGFSSIDLQIMFSHLFDGIISCHSQRITHRDIKPSTILVCFGNNYQSRQFYHSRYGNRGLILKLVDFNLSALAKGYVDMKGDLIETDKFTAPEVDAVTKATGFGFQPTSDLWSLGLVLYYISTNGNCPFDSAKHARELTTEEEVRKLLERHSLQERCPMIHDLVERLVRPAPKRANLILLRCHPFLWMTSTRKKLVIEFANVSSMKGHESIDMFLNDMDRYAPHYVYGTDGWVVQLNGTLASHVQPPSLKTDYWWSGRHLLQAIRNLLVYPESLQSTVYSRFTPCQTIAALLKQTLDMDFPRLLILLYELGGVHGRWEWDGDDVYHMWK